MTWPSFTELCFNVETLRFDAVATLQALCNRFEPDHADGLRMLLNAAEYVQHTVIGPPETDPRRMLNPTGDLPSSCRVVDFDEPTDLARQLTEHGWPTEVQTIWDEDDDDSDHFADSARSVLAFRFERTLRVTVSRPEARRPLTGLIERGQYLACTSGERLFFTDALCRLPLDRDIAELDLTAIPGFWLGALRAECSTCDTHWRVDPSGDFYELGANAAAPVWNFFEEAANRAYISATFACPDPGCTGRVTLALT
jgi:hypothetical protein